MESHPNWQVLMDIPGKGAKVERQHIYLIRWKLWLNKGDPIKWKSKILLVKPEATYGSDSSPEACLTIERLRARSNWA